MGPSRVKLRPVTDCCADCGLREPGWASINRGILICDGCCSVHRSLGRHVSQVKHLYRDHWNQQQLTMVHTLYGSGVNSIWEHALLDPHGSIPKGGRKKPSPKDPIRPTKAEYIRAKHQNLAFVYRVKKDNNELNLADVSKQLHASVRTGNVETSLHLLTLGADPNYWHPERGTCPIHVAAKSGQSLQVELLAVYGADPGAVDGLGNTPVDYARMGNYTDLANRLTELQYELTDRLAQYVCGRKPDHVNGQHYIIPEMADSLEVCELSKTARKKLQALPNSLFEELAADVYDEVDRRHNDDIWLSSQNYSTVLTDRYTVPFLPVNSEYSSTRNQGRQKLARFNAREFTLLIIDVLSEAKRRQVDSLTASVAESVQVVAVSPMMSSHPPKPPRIATAVAPVDPAEDNEPLYDSVASDDDYATLVTGPSDNVPDTPPDSSAANPVRAQETEKVTDDGPISLQDYLEIRSQLSSSEYRIQQLLQSNQDMRREIAVLQAMVQKLMVENSSLRTPVCTAPPPPPPSDVPPTPATPSREYSLASPRLSTSFPAPVLGRPQSMYEPRERQQKWGVATVMLGGGDGRSSPATATSLNSLSRKEPRFHITAVTPVTLSEPISLPCLADSSSSPGSSVGELATVPVVPPPAAFATPEPSTSDSDSLPSQPDVIKKTEQITRSIQELLMSAQVNKHDSYVVCSEKIYSAALSMASIFPLRLSNEHISTCLKQLISAALRLQTETRSLVSSHGAQDNAFITHQVIQCAYDVAKAAKTLVSNFQ